MIEFPLSKNNQLISVLGIPKIMFYKEYQFSNIQFPTHFLNWAE